MLRSREEPPCLQEKGERCMRYFFISQDLSLSWKFRFQDSDSREEELAAGEDGGQVKTRALLYLCREGHGARPDFAQDPAYLFSGRLKGILQAYEPELALRDVTLMEERDASRPSYLQVFLEPVDAVSRQAGSSGEQAGEHLILSEEKARGHHLFLLESRFGRHLAVSLPLAESLLRRKVTGICFQEAEVE